MKIAFVNNHYQLGGAETVVRQLHEGMLAAGHQSTLYVSEGKTYPEGKNVTPLYHPFLSRLDHSRFRNYVYLLAPRYKWTDKKFRKLAHSDADLVHIHSFHGLYASMESMAYLAERKPVVWTFHRFWGITGGCDHPFDCTRYKDACGSCPRVGEWPIGNEDNTSAELQKKHNILKPAPLHIVSPSEHLAQKVIESPVGKNWAVTNIPNGVDPAGFSYERKHDEKLRSKWQVNSDTLTILVVIRDYKDPIKGFTEIKEAVKHINPAGVQLILAGGNSDWAIEQLPDDLNVVNAGYISSRSDMAELYEISNIFLYASPGENFPCVILEAMSAKCAVVSTPTDGVLEQVVHQETGVMAEEISGKSLGAALSEAIADKTKCQQFGEAARRRVEKLYSEQVMINQHIDLYKQIIKKNN